MFSFPRFSPHFSFEHGWMQAATPLQRRLLGMAWIWGRSLGISITHSSCKPQGWLNRFFPHLLSKALQILAAKEQDRNFRAMRRYKFLVLLAGEVVLLHLCSMSRELCYTLLAKISKYGCQGLLSDTKPTRPKIDALLSGPVYLRTNHAMQGVQLLFFCFWHLLSPYRLSSSDFLHSVGDGEAAKKCTPNKTAQTDQMWQLEMERISNTTKHLNKVFHTSQTYRHLTNRKDTRTSNINLAKIHAQSHLSPRVA